MTEELCNCPVCGFDRALTHYSNDNVVNWIACPKCRAVTDNSCYNKPEELQKYAHDEYFWKKVDEDTNFCEDKIV